MFRAPFAESFALKRDRGERSAGENSVPSQKLFSEFFGKGLTEQNANVLFEIFPLTGSGSLKFTLYD